MTSIIDPTIRAAFDGYAANLKNPSFDSDQRIISVGRAAGLAWESAPASEGQERNLWLSRAQAIWNEVPVVAGMPSFADFRAGYEAHQDAFAEAFKTGSTTYPTAPGTPFSNAAGSYARALHYATIAKARAGANGPEHWAGVHGVNALTAAGFPAQAQRIHDAIENGVALEVVNTPNIIR